MSNTLSNDNEYREWLKELKIRIRQSQAKASVRVNSALLELYWSIGENIVLKQEQFGWGSGVIPQLSRDLRIEFPDISGFSVTNLQYANASICSTAKTTPSWCRFPVMENNTKLVLKIKQGKNKRPLLRLPIQLIAFL